MCFRVPLLAGLVAIGIGMPLAGLAADTMVPANNRDLDIFAALRSEPARAIAYLRQNYPGDEAVANCIRLIESIGQPCDFKFTALDGRWIDSRDYRGQVVMLDFWFKTCGGCIAVMPKFKEAVEQYASQGFVVINVSMDRTKADAEEFIRRFSLTDPVYFIGNGPDHEFVKRLCVTAAPHGVLIDRQGRLRFLSAPPSSNDTFQRIEALLAEKTPGVRSIHY